MSLDLVHYMAEHGHEQVITCVDRESGLRAIIALHNTRRGPAMGGTRLWTYASGEDALRDVLRLSEGMTYKAAVAGLPLGGGKAVILADGQERDPQVRTARLLAYGRCVDGLQGRFITAEDVGTTPADMLVIRRATRFVEGVPTAEGGGGNPAPVTALGVLEGMRALALDVLGAESLAGLRVAIQGLGSVGLHLARDLVAQGATVIATDVRPEVAQAARAQLPIETVEPDAIYEVPCDIFAPCALGGVLNDQTIPRLACRLVAGCANNQLEDERHAALLHARGIVYGVDYVLNAGGLINVAQELQSGGYGRAGRARALRKTKQIYQTTRRMLAIARVEGISTQQAAHQLALEALEAADEPARSPAVATSGRAASARRG
jgi:leucine dehydrogenase